METHDMTDEVEVIKSNIKEYYSGDETWRDDFANTTGMSLMSRMINYLKRKEHSSVLKIMERLSKRGKLQGLVADAGCGNGLYTISLARSYSSVQFQAIDFSPAMCAQVQRKVRSERLPNVAVSQGDIDNLPFAPASVDVLLCIDTLHHVPDAAIGNTLQEFQRVLRPEGILLIDFKNSFNPYVYYSHKKRNRLTYYRTNRTLGQVQKHLQEAGFSYVLSRGVPCAPAFLAPYVVVVGRKE